MPITYYVIVPAYGRDYKTEEEVKTAWVNGKDFRIKSIDRQDGRCISIHDAKHARLSVQIRYNRLRDVFVWPEPAISEDETPA
jgi:hypothetical protein